MRAYLLAVLLIAGIYAGKPLNEVKSPTLNKFGVASVDGIIKFEDVEKLSPAMKSATALLRSRQFAEAERAFQEIEHQDPSDALAYKGEIEAAGQLDTLGKIIERYKKRLAEAEVRPHQDDNVLAALHYALGVAIMIHNGYNSRYIGDNPSELGHEPKSQLIKALKLEPKMLVSHLALAAYYEHPSLGRYTDARREYDIALHLRPDLFKICYLHALTWSRPGYVTNKKELLKIGIKLPDDKQMIPLNTIRECLDLIHDHPEYAPPYLLVSELYR